MTTWARKHQIEFGWQPGYQDRVIRTDREFRRIRHYIIKNPERWHKPPTPSRPNTPPNLIPPYICRMRDKNIIGVWAGRPGYIQTIGRRWILFGMFWLIVQGLNGQSTGTGDYIIPAPIDLQAAPGMGDFTWKLTSIVALPDGPGKNAMNAYSRWLQSRNWPDELWEDYGFSPTISGEVDPSITHPEGYRLTLDRDGANLYARTEAGFYYGMQSLIQLIERHLKGNWAVIPAQEITDAPIFSWRGMHLDVSRHYFPLDSVKKYIDWMARYKMNTFHWHLTDDQGWRMEIPSFPDLQKVAAWRDETLIGHYSEQPHRFDGKRYGGYYTREEVLELVQYATERQVTIVPEIEMPGHARAALAAYPNLSCSGDSLPVATKWGVFEEVFCTKEETFEFLYAVLDEVISVFPGKYIHIGGDECPKTEWKKCPTCQANIQLHGLSDEYELQSWFIGRIDTFLAARGRTLIGWDEILEGGLSENAAVMSWRGTQGAVEAARAGHPVVLCPTSHAYFDYYQSEAPDEPLAIGGHLPLEKVYSLDPVPAELGPAERPWVLGAQGNIWTEYMPDYDQVEYMAFPRMLAMAEVTWTGKDRPGFMDFARRLVRHFPVLDASGVEYGTQILEPDVHVELRDRGLYFHAEKFMDSGELRYTVNGKEPDSRSPRYRKPVRIRKATTAKCALFARDGSRGPVKSVHIVPGKESGARITGTPPASTYAGMGLSTLINGVAPPVLKHGGKEWLGWWKLTPGLHLEWDRPVKADSLHIQFYRSEGSWIYLPKGIQCKLNGHEARASLTWRKGEGNTWWYSIPLGKGTRLRSVDLILEPVERIADGAQGAGQPAWIFAGQIRVE